jgi:hypothetical protein
MGIHGKMFIKNTRYKILTPNGFKFFDGINKKEEPTIMFSFSNGKSIEVTNDHRFDDVVAENLKVGDKVPTIDGFVTVEDIKYNKNPKNVYDPINVGGNLYIGNDVINHNCKFLGSANTVIDTTTLERLITQYIDPKQIDLDGNLLIYEKPQSGCSYVMGCDTAKGTGEHYSAIQVLKIISMKPIKMEQVALYFNNTIDVYAYADVINRLSYYYNNAYIMVENNSEGAAIVNRLWWDLENENLVNTGSKAINLGIRATKNSKPKAVLLMKKLIEDGSLILVDRETIEELTAFVDEGGRYFGKEKEDDAVSALYWACFILEMKILDESYEFEKSKQEEDGWGILSDINIETEDWSWLQSGSFRD